MVMRVGDGGGGEWKMAGCMGEVVVEAGGGWYSWLRSCSVCQTLVSSCSSKSSCSEPRRLVLVRELGDRDPLGLSRVPFPGICHANAMRLCLSSSSDDMSKSLCTLVFRTQLVVVVGWVSGVWFN